MVNSIHETTMSPYQWIGFVGKILTGNPWVFTIKLIGVSGVNFPIIQFYDITLEGWLLPPINKW